jgi:hypothetical protein
MRVSHAVGAGIVLLGIFQTAEAAFVTPTEWTRPATDAEAQTERTTFQEWNVFASPAGPNDPDVAEINPNAGIGYLFDTSGGSFVTGGGNIYSPSAVLSLDADIPSYGLGAGYGTTVLFQLRSLGNEADYDTVRLTYEDGDGTAQTISALSRQELERIQLGGFGGSQVDSLFVFDVPFSPESFKIEFDAAGTSLSVDRVAVDTFSSVVPEPTGAMGLLIAAGLLSARVRRRPRN